MRMVIAVCLFFMSAISASAATFYVTKTGSDANDCTAAQNSSTPKLTLISVLGCESAGDTIMIGDGTYTDTSIASLIASGASTSARTTLQAMNRRQAIYKPSTSSTGGHVLLFSAKTNIALVGLVIDGADLTFDTIKLQSSSTGMLFDDLELRNSKSQGLLCQSNSANGILRNSYIHHSGDSVNGLEHGIYLNTGCDNWLIEHNELAYNSGISAQLYAQPKNTLFQYNYIHDNCDLSTGGLQELQISHESHTVFRNVVVSTKCRVGIQISLQGPLNNKIQQNSVYCLSGTCSVHAGGIGIANYGVSTEIANNIVLGFTTPLGGTGTGTLIDNLTTGAAADIWTNPAAYDLTLKAGSVAIDGGTSIGLSSCGVGPDQGAFESPKVTAAIIFGNLLDVTICNIAPPIIPGTFTVGCTGTGCGTPVVSTVSLLGGSGGIVRLELSGITGGNCAAGQTWTVSTSSTDTTDSALVGGTYNQLLHTTTNFAVDSTTCDGTGGGSAPGGVIGQYEWEGNADDTSGSANHATVSNTSYVTGLSGQGLQTTDGADSYADTGLLSGHNPSTTHLVVATWVYIDPAQLGKTRDIWGVPTGTNQRFLLYRHSSNVWYMSIQGISGTASEFPVVSGWTHVCVKANATSDTAVLYVNGVAGTVSGASSIAYTSYTFAGDLRFGLPSGFGTTLSGTQTFDHSYLYTSDVSCADLYAAGQPSTGSAMSVQATHQWQGVFTASGGTAEDRGAADAQRTVVKGGAGALMVQLDNSSGASLVLQPRFRYNINGGSFTNVVPDSPTADGVSYWGGSIPSGLNSGTADGPISGALAHTDGVTLTTSAAIPTITLANNTSYTLRGIFLIDAAVNDVVCFKIYDQGGSALASYTPAAGSCLTVIAPQATGAQ